MSSEVTDVHKYTTAGYCIGVRRVIGMFTALLVLKPRLLKCSNRARMCFCRTVPMIAQQWYHWYVCICGRETLKLPLV
jgi:hypothetical protein